MDHRHLDDYRYRRAFDAVNRLDDDQLGELAVLVAGRLTTEQAAELGVELCRGRQWTGEQALAVLDAWRSGTDPESVVEQLHRRGPDESHRATCSCSWVSRRYPLDEASRRRAFGEHIARAAATAIHRGGTIAATTPEPRS